MRNWERLGRKKKGFTFYCFLMTLFSAFRTRGPAFSFCTGSHTSCSWLCSQFFISFNPWQCPKEILESDFLLSFRDRQLPPVPQVRKYQRSAVPEEPLGRRAPWLVGEESAGCLPSSQPPVLSPFHGVGAGTGRLRKACPLQVFHLCVWLCAEKEALPQLCFSVWGFFLSFFFFFCARDIQVFAHSSDQCLIYKQFSSSYLQLPRGLWAAISDYICLW